MLEKTNFYPSFLFDFEIYFLVTENFVTFKFKEAYFPQNVEIL